jgi:nucleoside-diphosphate-sugar epimerase
MTSRRIYLVPRELRAPQSKELLYFISTTDNYNVFDDMTRDVDTNLRVLMEVLQEIRDRPDRTDCTINFISSWFVYGDGPLPAREDQFCCPKGFYSITKLAAEQLIQSFCATFGVRYRILRLANVYGPSDLAVSAKRNALQFLVEKLRRNEDIELYHG